MILIKPLYETNELNLFLSDTRFAPMAADYYLRNKEFLAPYEPTRDVDFFSESHQKQLLQDDCRNAEDNSGYRFWIIKKTQPNIIIGSVALNSIVWGAFFSCFLGYKLDKDNLNRGYMTQAVKKCVEIAFNDIGLHRIEANIMPRNKASLRVTQKAGFVNEGLSKEYLKINGIWEDHVHMVNINH